MSFIARCPNCLSTYRVMEEQLLPARGLVRCGRCSETFDALRGRVDGEAPGRRPGPTAMPPGSPHVPPRAPLRAGGSTVESAAMAAAQPDPAAPMGVTVLSRPDAAALIPGRQAPATLPSDPDEGAASAPALDSDDVASGRSRLGSDAGSREMRSSHVSARQVPRRWLWGSVAALASVVLGAQAVVAWHDQVAQSLPMLKPAVEVVCVMVDCRVEAARQLQAMSVESSELVQTGGTVYQLNLVLRSRADREIAAPAIDLKLTDMRQEVVIRRVLRMSDFGLRGGSIAPRQELTLQAALNTGEKQIAGYNIELFYP